MAVALIELIALNAFVEFTEGVEIEDYSADGTLIYYLSLLLLVLLMSVTAGDEEEVIKSLNDLTSLMVDPILFSGVYLLVVYDFLLSLHRSSSTSEKVTHFL